MEHLRADADVMELGSWVKRLDVGVHPPEGVPGVGERRNVAVGDGDGDEDAGVGEGFDDVGIDVKDFDPVDYCSGFQELGDLRVWWEVVAEGAVVDADGVYGGGEEEEEEEEEEKNPRKLIPSFPSLLLNK